MCHTFTQSHLHTVQWQCPVCSGGATAARSPAFSDAHHSGSCQGVVLKEGFKGLPGRSGTTIDRIFRSYIRRNTAIGSHDSAPYALGHVVRQASGQKLLEDVG